MTERSTRLGIRIGWRFKALRWNMSLRRTLPDSGGTIPPVVTEVEVAERLHFGAAYKPDPRGGRRDVMRHPRMVQKAIDANAPVGDCEDHAAYWLATLFKSGYVTKGSVGTVHGLFGDKVAGHAVALWTGTDNVRRTADYAAPTIYTGDWGWVPVYAAKYNIKVFCATMYRVESFDTSTDSFTLRPDAFKGG